MIWIIIKEFKQFARSKGNLISFFIFPLILITVLSLGLKGVIDNAGEDIFKGENNEKSIIYYYFQEENEYSKSFNYIKSGIEEAISIEFIENKDEENSKKETDEYKSIAYITINNNGFDIYTSKNGENTKSKIFTSIFKSILSSYSAYDTVYKYNSKDVSKIVEVEYNNYISIGNEGIRNITASEYYTFAELALIILYISTLVGESTYAERKMNTINRLRLTKLSEGKILFSKIIFGSIVGVIEIIIVYLYTSLILKVNWGDNTLKLILLFLIFGVFVSTLGAVIGMLSSKDTTAGSLLNVIIVVSCALGGCYVPLQVLISIPILNNLMYLDPVYWINIATSSLICNYSSYSYYIALIFPIVLSFLISGIFLITRKRRGGFYNA